MDTNLISHEELTKLCGGRSPHRADGWTKEMLPEGWRPLLLGEKDCDEDEKRVLVTWVSTRGERHRAADSDWVHHRTRRPLPQSAEPVVVEKSDADPFLQAIRQRDAALEERDQLRKELEKATREVPRLEAELAGCGRQLGDVTRIAREQRERADSLTTENAVLKERLKHSSLRQLELKQDAQLLESQLSQLKWKPISTPPTEMDGVKFRLGSGLISPPKVLWCGDTFVMDAPWNSPPSGATGWMSILSLLAIPSTSPPETEEQAMRREYDAWLATKPWPNQHYVPTATEYGHGLRAYQAAKQSTTQPEPATT